MSRLVLGVLAMTMLSRCDAHAMALTDEEIKELIDRQRQTISIDSNGCLKNLNDKADEIVVCGEPEENKTQRLPIKAVPDENKLRRGEAVSTTRAAAKDNRNCGVIGSGLGCIELPKNWVKFGGVPPRAILFSEVIKGLPEPDAVVTEGSAQEPR